MVNATLGIILRLTSTSRASTDSSRADSSDRFDSSVISCDKNRASPMSTSCLKTSACWKARQGPNTAEAASRTNALGPCAACCKWSSPEPTGQVARSKYDGRRRVFPNAPASPHSLERENKSAQLCDATNGKIRVLLTRRADKEIRASQSSREEEVFALLKGVDKKLL